MIFTDRFVYVHEPKTGGTFVTSMLFWLYGLRWTRWTHLRNALFGEVRRRHPRYGALVHMAGDGRRPSRLRDIGGSVRGDGRD